MKTPAPLPGSILPTKRIVAFYGNPLSKKMGILGEIPYDQMLTKLDSVVAQWKRGRSVDAGASRRSTSSCQSRRDSREKTGCTASARIRT